MKNTDLLILNAILLVYPLDLFEFVAIGKALGPFSPFRVIIMPLCFLYILLRVRGSHFQVNKLDIVIIALFFTSCIMGIMMDNPTSVLSFIGNILQFFMAYIVMRHVVFEKSTLLVITTWALLEIPVLLVNIVSGNIGMALRFQGLFFDPNYLCAFVIPSIWAAFFLIKRYSGKFLALYSFGIMCFGIIMVILSFSRGGMLALLLTIILFLSTVNKKLLVTLLVLIIPVVSYMVVRSTTLTWSDGAENVLDGFIYRVFTLSEDASALTAGRSDYIEIFFKNINDFILIGTDLDYYIEHYNGGGFPHNGFIEIIVQGGLIFGGLYIFKLGLNIAKELIRAFKLKAVCVELMVVIGMLVPLTFLSYNSKVAWLCMGIFFSLSNKKVQIWHSDNREG